MNYIYIYIYIYICVCVHYKIHVIENVDDQLKNILFFRFVIFISLSRILIYIS